MGSRDRNLSAEGSDTQDTPSGAGVENTELEAQTLSWVGQDLESSLSTMGLPESIGEYTILGVLGEGGMGVVYEAEQQVPRRRVALKVVRGGHFVDEQRLKMFQREAESLARLKHPGVGAIYQAGRTEQGQHFFAMELVRGQTLNRYLYERSVSWSSDEVEVRLRIFQKICQAVNYAHQRGVIHRDLKPSNIVVTDSHGLSGEEPLPAIKILDFGLARITDSDMAAATMVSEIGVIKGTLPYMSPEQARGNPYEIDLRTDIYSLGVILYEMLTDTRPYQTQDTSLMEAIRIINERTPKPLVQSWKGARKPDDDLQTIVDKALQKEADQRYESAAAFSEDIERYLTSQPILARSPSTFYQLRKLVVRNKVSSGFVAVLAALLIGFGFWMSILYSKVSEEAEVTRQVSDFMVGLFEVSDPGEARGNSVTAREILDRGRVRIAEDLADRPEIQARLMQTMGSVYSALGLYDQAAELFERVLDLREGDLAGEPLAVASVLTEFATLEGRRGRFEEARQLAQRAVALREDNLGKRHPEVAASLNALGVALQNLDELPESEVVHRRALEIREAAFGPDHSEVSPSLHNLAIVRYFQGDYAEAEELYKRAAEVRENSNGPNDYELATSLHTLAILYQDLGRLDEALPLERRSLEIREQVLGPDHPHVALSLTTLANIYRGMGDPKAAEPLLARAVVIGDEKWGPLHPDVRWMHRNLARTLAALGRFDEAESGLRRLIRVIETEGKEADLSSTLFALSSLLAGEKRFVQAEELGLRAIDIDERTYGKDHPYVAEGLQHMAGLYHEQGRIEEASEAYRRALEIYRASVSPNDSDRRNLEEEYALFLESTGREQEAESLRVQQKGQ